MPLRTLVLLLCCIPLTYAHAWSADADEREKLQGTWRFVNPSEKDNKKEEKRAAMRIVFEGSKITFVAEGKKPTAQGAYKVDPTKDPKTIDIILEKDGKKVTTLAIYDVSGDTLKICHYLGPSATKERPKEFTADKKTVLGILKRHKK